MYIHIYIYVYALREKERETRPPRMPFLTAVGPGASPVSASVPPFEGCLARAPVRKPGGPHEVSRG